MPINEKIKDIIQTMIEYDLIDKSRLYDVNYVRESILIYLDACQFVNENFKVLF